MAVDPNALTAGKCYVSGRQIRRIKRIIEDRVDYEARGAKPITGSWPSRPLPVFALPTREQFAASVEREVPEDCDLDAGSA